MADMESEATLRLRLVDEITAGVKSIQKANETLIESFINAEREVGNLTKAERDQLQTAQTLAAVLGSTAKSTNTSSKAWGALTARIRNADQAYRQFKQNVATGNTSDMSFDQWLQGYGKVSKSDIAAFQAGQVGGVSAAQNQQIREQQKLQQQISAARIAATNQEVSNQKYLDQLRANSVRQQLADVQRVAAANQDAKMQNARAALADYDRQLNAGQPALNARSTALAQMLVNEEAEAQAVARHAQNLPRLRYALYDVATTATFTGLALTGLTTGAAAVTISMQRAFADVQRTTGTAGKAADDLRKQFEDLFTSMPTSWGDLTEIGTLAGQLGIAKDSVAEFTKLVAQFAATTDVSVNDSATAFGRLSTLLKVPASEFQNLGSSILAVGTDSVATESQIISISKEIAGIANTAGLSAAQVFGLSATLASLGIQPELARGTLTRLFSNISVAAADGGARLKAFAQVSGQTVDQFKKQWGTDAAGAIQSLMAGLSGLDNSNAYKVLSQLGITAARDVPAILRLAQNHELLAREMGVAAKAYQDGTALQDQYSVITSTVAEKLKVLVNNFQEFIGVAGQSAGALGGVIDVAIVLLKVFTQLIDNPVTATILGVVGALAAIAGPALLAVGVLVRMTASWIAMRTAMMDSAVAMGIYETQAAAASVSTTKLMGSVAAATGSLNIFKVALKGALISTGIGALLVGVSLGIDAIGAATESAGDKTKKFFGDLSGLNTAVAADTAEWQKTGQAIAVYTNSLPNQSTQTDSAKDSAAGLATVLGDVKSAALDASGAAHQSALAFGKASEQFLIDQLRQSDAFNKSASNADFQAYWKTIGANINDAMAAAAKDGRVGIDRYFTDLEQEALKRNPELAKKLLPQIGDPGLINLAYGPLNDLKGALGGVADQIQQNVDANNILGVSATDAGDDVTTFAQKVTDSVSSFTDVIQGTYDLQGALYGLGSALGENGLSFDQFSVAGRTNMAALLQVIDAVAQQSGGDAAATAANLQGLYNYIITASPQAASAISFLKDTIASLAADAKVSVAALPAPSLTNYSSLVAGLGDGYQKAAEAADRAAKAAERQAKKTKDLAKEVRTLVDYANDLKKVMDRASDIRFGSETALDKITSSWSDVRKATQDAIDKIREYRDSLQSLNAKKGTLTYQLGVAVQYGDTKRADEIRADLASTNTDIASTQKDLTQAQADNSKTLKGNTDAAIKNRGTIKDLVGSYGDLINQYAASGMSQAQLKVKTAQLKQEFINQATQMGFSRTEVMKYARSFDDMRIAISKVPRNVTISTDPRPAMQAFKEFEAQAKKSLSNVRSDVAKGLGTPKINAPKLLGDWMLPPMDSSKWARQQMLMAKLAFERTQAATATTNFMAKLWSEKATTSGSQLLSGSYADGGYTGSGGKYQPAGVVHKNEYVMNSNTVNRYGVDFFDKLQKGQMPFALTGGTGGPGMSVSEQVLADMIGRSVARYLGPLQIGTGAVGAAARASNAASNAQGRF